MAKVGVTADGLTEAALVLADEAGIGSVTLSALARRLGVAAPSLYAHVGGLDELKARMAVAALKEMADLAEPAIGGRAGGEALTALAGAYRDYALAHPGRYDASTSPLDGPTAAASAGPRHAALARAALRQFALSDDDLVHATRLVGSLVAGFIALERSGAFDHSRPAPATSWVRAWESLDVLLRSWTPPPPAALPAVPAATPTDPEATP